MNEVKEAEVNQKIIGRVTKTKYHGQNIDEYLVWKDQYKQVKAKLKSGISALQMLKEILPRSMVAAVCRALIMSMLSHLRYGSIIRGCISDTKLDTLKKFKSRAKKID